MRTVLKYLVALLALSVLVMGSPEAQAQVSDDVLTALKGRRVTVVKRDGSEVVGKILNSSPTNVVLEQSDGNVLTIPRANVAKVRTIKTAVPAPAPAVEPPPGGVAPSGPPAVPGGAVPPGNTRSNAGERATADFMVKLGMGLTLGGIGMVILAGILHGTMASCGGWDSCISQAQATLALPILGPLTAAAGNPVWAIGAVKRTNLKKA